MDVVRAPQIRFRSGGLILCLLTAGCVDSSSRARDRIEAPDVSGTRAEVPSRPAALVEPMVRRTAHAAFGAPSDGAAGSGANGEFARSDDADLLLRLRAAGGPPSAVELAAHLEVLAEPSVLQINLVPPASLDAGVGDTGAPNDAIDGLADAGLGVSLSESLQGTERTATEQNLRVAFIADQGSKPAAFEVLDLIRSEQAHMVIHGGDLDYHDGPADWEAMIDGVLGADFPYFASVGNHDLPAWPGPDGYRAKLEARLARVEGAECTGEYGVNSACTYRGLFFALSGVGVKGSGHIGFLREALANDNSVFQICDWHKNQRDMQVGAKSDEVGWAAYQVCQDAGAMIVNGHEHSYSRTFALQDVGNRSAGHGATGDPDLLLLSPGTTMVLVSGLGGSSVRDFRLDLHSEDTWWAAAHARGHQVRSGVHAGSDDHIAPGALFIDFHVDGDGRRARGYFKTTRGQTVDSFEVVVGE